MNLSHEEIELVNSILLAGRKRPLVASSIAPLPVTSDEALDAVVLSILNAGRTRPLGASAGSQPGASAQATARVPAASDETLEATVRSILAAGKVQKPLGAPAAVSYPDASVTSPTTLQMTAEEQELVISILVAGKPKPPMPAKANPVPAAPTRAQPSAPIAPCRYGFFPATPPKVAVSDQVARDVRTYKLWFQDRVDRGIQAY